MSAVIKEIHLFEMYGIFLGNLYNHDSKFTSHIECKNIAVKILNKIKLLHSALYDSINWFFTATTLEFSHFQSFLLSETIVRFIDLFFVTATGSK